MTAVTLSATEARALADTGRVLWVRPVKEQPPEGYIGMACWNGEMAWTNEYDESIKYYDDIHVIELNCPLRPGMVVWGRETWNAWVRGVDVYDPYLWTDLHKDERNGLVISFIAYAATDKVLDPGSPSRKWMSPVTMPKWASRFPALRVGEVRCVRVCELGEADICLALGVPLEYPGPGPAPYRRQLDKAMAFEWNARFGKAAPYATAYAWAALLTVDKGE